MDDRENNVFISWLNDLPNQFERTRSHDSERREMCESDTGWIWLPNQGQMSISNDSRKRVKN